MVNVYESKKMPKKKLEPIAPTFVFYVHTAHNEAYL